MPEWLKDLADTERLLTTAFILFILWLMGRSILKSWKFWSKLVGLINGLVGTDEKPGIMARMESMESQVATIHHETTPNHGGSIKDAVARIETGLETERTTLTDHIKETEPMMPMLQDMHKKYIGDQAATPATQPGG